MPPLIFILWSLPSASYQSGLAKVRRPWTPTRCKLLARAVCSWLWVFWTGNQRSLLPPIRVLGSELGLRWPNCWAQLAQMLGYASAVSLSPFRCAFAVGVSIPFLDSSTELWLLSRHTCSSTSSVSSYEPALFVHFLASLGSHGVTPPPFWPTLTFSSRAVPLLGFWLLWRSLELQLRWRRSPRRLQGRFFC